MYVVFLNPILQYSSYIITLLVLNTSQFVKAFLFFYSFSRFTGKSSENLIERDEFDDDPYTREYSNESGFGRSSKRENRRFDDFSSYENSWEEDRPRRRSWGSRDSYDRQDSGFGRPSRRGDGFGRSGGHRDGFGDFNIRQQDFTESQPFKKDFYQEHPDVTARSEVKENSSVGVISIRINRMGCNVSVGS